MKLLLGNRTARITGQLIRRAERLGIPCALENPHSSVLWQAPWVAPLLSFSSYREYVCDMCRFGSPWRKRTRIATWGVRLPRPRSKLSQPCLCGGRKGICSTTGDPHRILMGNAPGGVPWTKVAERYPSSFAKAFSSLLSDEVEVSTMDRWISLGTTCMQ